MCLQRKPPDLCFWKHLSIVVFVPNFCIFLNVLFCSLFFRYVNDSKLCCLLGNDVRSVQRKCQFNSTYVSSEVNLPHFTCDRLMHTPVLRVFIWFLGSSALIGNTVVILWRLLKKDDSGKRSQIVLILNLAASDFMMGLYMFIIAGADAHFQDSFFIFAEDWRGGLLCKFSSFLNMLSSEASLFFITLISIDRFLGIVFPFARKRLSLLSVHRVCLLMWSIALLISIPPVLLQDKVDGFYGLHDVCVGLPLKKSYQSSTVTLTDLPWYWPVDRNNKTVTMAGTPSWGYSVAVYLGLNLACCVTILVCYLAIAYVVFCKAPLQEVGDRAQHRKNEAIMALRMLLIVGTDFCCWMPVIIMGILSMTEAISISADTHAWIVVFLIPINSSLNPYLYTLSYYNIFSRKCCKK